MNNYLDTILNNKYNEVLKLKKEVKNNPKGLLAKVFFGETRIKQNKSFKKTLSSKKISIIGEIKRSSPSKGKLADITNPVKLAKQYELAGIDAISVLTDSQDFSGSINDLETITGTMKKTEIPILRKDFIIDEIQIAESILNGADAVLLITSIVKNKLKSLLEYCHKNNIDALVEVHNNDDLKNALEAGAEIIGVNNRNLSTFKVDTENAIRLKPNMPSHVISVAESGINSPTLTNRYKELGYHALLIGEALVTSTSPSYLISTIREGML